MSNMPIAVFSVVGVVVAIAMFLAGWYTYKRVSEGRVLSAEKLAEKIVREAEKEAEAQKKAAILEAKEEWFQAKQKFQKETQSARQEVQNGEKKLAEREANLNRRVDLLDRKEKDLARTEGDLSRSKTEVDEARRKLQDLAKEQNARLERIAGMTADEARQMLVQNMENEARSAAARSINEIRETAKRNAERESRRIMTIAIQRLAADHSIESTVSVVPLPNDEMKGRIIGREGRNIRAFETATGIDVIIDDTPEAVILSGFDPVRREVARVSLERLVSDGRIHPGRIEEVVGKATKEMEERIREIGEQTCLDLGMHGVHAEVIRLLGRLRYRTSYGQNILEHSKEVAYLTGMMAAELGLDAALAKRAGLFHDIGKAIDHEVEGPHAIIGMDLLRRCGEPVEVLEGVGYHHNEGESDSPFPVLVQAADAISGARPGARRETLETYIKRLEKLEEIADAFPGVEKAYALQAGREIRIMVEHKNVDDARAQGLAHEIARKIEKELQYPGQIKVLVIRETRAIEYAK
jgi:ribonuclease Y